MEERKEPEKTAGRRNSRPARATGAALLAASALSLPAEADQGKKEGDVLYGHGMVWNRDLPGLGGELRLSFDLRVNMQTGIGFGTAEDQVYTEAYVTFTISSLNQQRLP